MAKAKRYRKRPVEIEAVQLRWSTWGEVCDFLEGIVSEKNPGRYCDDPSDACGEPGPEYIELNIPMLEGDHLAKHGDYIIKGVRGEFYPIKEHIFRETYEPVR